MRYIAVDDVGTVINPMIVDGQVHGGIAQGVAQALYEEAIYDEEGNLSTGSMLSYLVPSAVELPNFELERTESPSPTNPMGVKGVGETGTIASTAAVMNAVVDALSPYGVTDVEMPAKPETGLARDPGRRCDVIPAKFDYQVADSVDHAIELLGSGKDAKLLAGGHSLLPLMRLRLARPELLVDIGRISDLSYVKEDGDAIAIGALTRYRDLEQSELLRAECPIVAETAGLVGDPQVRHRGTIGGSVAHCDPASDAPTVLLALDAELVAKGPKGERRLSVAESFGGFLQTALDPQEVLTEIRVPKTGSGGWAYEKFNRRAQDWATVAVAAVQMNGGAHVALTNMGPTALRAGGVEKALSSGSDPAEAAEKAAEGTSPPSDHNASGAYREHLARVLTRRALEQALG